MVDKKKPQVQFNKAPQEVLRDRRQRELQERMNKLKQPRQPHGGAPPVKVPPLNAEPLTTGGTMAEQAEILRDPTSPLSPAYSPELAMMSQRGGPPGSPRMAPGGGVQEEGGPFSIVGADAPQQPGFRPGIGSMYQGNQPALKKQQIAQDGYKPQLSEETRQTMQTLAEFQAVAERRQTMPQEKASDPQKETRKQQAAQLEQQLSSDVDLFKELQDVLDDPAQWNLLNNPTRRKEIEGRLDPMDITDVILHGEVRQTVPIVPNKLEVSYRSVSGDEDLAVKQMMFGESGGDRYLMDKYTIMQLTLALVSINGEELPTQLNDKKKFDETKFLVKFSKVSRFPVQLIADLGIQYLWFDERVRRLFIGGTDELKNS
jgi:hypothetical protein